MPIVEYHGSADDWLSASYVEEHGITTVELTGEGQIQESTWADPDTGESKTTTRLVVPVRFEGQPATGGPTQWKVNHRSSDALRAIFGADTREWVGRPVEITLGGQGKMRHILVDEARTRKSNPGADAGRQANLSDGGGAKKEAAGK